MPAKQFQTMYLKNKINKSKKAHYVLIETDTNPAALHEMERNMRLNEDVVRYLTVRNEELSKGPSSILSRGDRDEQPAAPSFSNEEAA